MQWCIAAWNEISADSIQNCFSFTGLFANDHATDEQVMNETDELDSDLTATLRELPIRERDRMSTEEMISLPTESEIVSYEMTDEEILLSATSTDDGNDDVQEKTSIEPPSHSTKTKLESIAVVLSLLNIAEKSDLAVYNSLRALQRALRMKEGKQTTLHQWFRPNSAHY